MPSLRLDVSLRGKHLPVQQFSVVPSSAKAVAELCKDVLALTNKARNSP